MIPDAVCMVFSTSGNAYHSFDYTPEALEAEASRLRRERGETTTVTVAASPFIVSASGGLT